MSRRQFAVGTRGSALALRQAHLIVDALAREVPAGDFVIKTIQTEGDQKQDRAVSDIGDKGIFTRALEQALLRGDIDLAVHSLKDVPSDVETPELTLAAFFARADPRDCLISRNHLELRKLPTGAKVGTGSLRRKVQIEQVRPDLALSPIRGNVDTRLRKLNEGEFDAIVLAVAGLERLGLSDQITEYFPLEEFVPDCGQGIIGVQTRKDDEVSDLVGAIDDSSSRTAALAERATVQALGATCRSPVGVHADVQSGWLELRAVAASEDGGRLVRLQERAEVDRGEETGRQLGSRLLKELQQLSALEIRPTNSL